MGIDKDGVEFSIYDALIDEVEIKYVIQKTEFENLWICPSNVNLAGAEVEMVSIKNREYLLKNIVGPLRTEFDYIIIDCPPSLGLLTLNAFVSADSALVPIQCEYYALEAVSYTQLDVYKRQILRICM